MSANPEISQARLLASEAVRSAVFTQAHDAVLVLDDVGMVCVANPAAERLFASPPGGNVGKVLAPLLPPDWRDGTKVYNTVVVDDRGEYHDVEATIGPLEIDGSLLAVAVLRDVSERLTGDRERLRTHRLLEQAKQDWEQTFDAIGECILLLDQEGTIARVNQEACRRSGRDFPEIMGRAVGDVFGPEVDAAVRVAVAGVRGQSAAPITAPIFGGIFEVSAYTRTLAETSAHQTIVILADVTEKERLRRQLLHSEKLSAVGEFISGIAHELNNPLTSMLGFTQMLSLKDEDGKFERELRHLREESLRASRIVKNLLIFSRRQEPMRVATNLNEIVRRAASLREYDLRVRNVRLETDLGPDIPDCMMDAGQIQQVVLNLVNNAEHAIHGARDSGRIRISTERRGNRLLLTVADDGPGVPEDLQSQVFNPFFTTKPVGKGTGLGLSICDGIARDHQGELRLEPSSPTGARFVLELPLVSPAEEEAGGAPEDALTAGVLPCRVLLVDDEQAIRELGQEYLEEAGHLVTVAEDGQAALQALREGEFDVVLTDLRMPRLSGEELYDLAVAEMPRYRDRFVLVTGSASVQGSTQRLESLGIPVIAKPFDLNVLVQAVEAVGRA